MPDAQKLRILLKLIDRMGEGALANLRKRVAEGRGITAKGAEFPVGLLKIACELRPGGGSSPSAEGGSCSTAAAASVVDTTLKRPASASHSEGAKRRRVAVEQATTSDAGAGGALGINASVRESIWAARLRCRRPQQRMLERVQICAVLKLPLIGG